MNAPAVSLDAHEKYAFPLGVTADGDYLATGGWDGTLSVWETTDWTAVASTDGHSKSVACGAVTTDGDLVTGSTDTTVRRWTLPDLAPVGGHEAHAGTVAGMAAHPTQPLVASGSYDETVCLWALDDATRACTGHAGNVTCVAFAPSRSVVLGGGLGPDLLAWSLDDPDADPLARLGDHGAAVVGVTVDADGKPWSLGYSGTVRRWTETWMPDVSFAIDGDGAPTGFAADPTDDRFAVTHDHGVTLVDAVGDVLATHETSIKGIYAPVWAPDGAWVAVAGADGTVRCFA